MKFENFENATIEAKARVGALAQKVYGTPIEKLTKDQIVQLIEMAMNIGVNKVAIRSIETRRTSVQFCTNTYEQSCEIDFKDVWAQIKDQVKSAENPLDKFLELSKLFHEFMIAKIEQYSNMLKKAIHDEMLKDKIEIIPNSRFTKE